MLSMVRAIVPGAKPSTSRMLEGAMLPKCVQAHSCRRISHTHVLYQHTWGGEWGPGCTLHAKHSTRRDDRGGVRGVSESGYNPGYMDRHLACACMYVGVQDVDMAVDER